MRRRIAAPVNAALDVVIAGAGPRLGSRLATCGGMETGRLTAEVPGWKDPPGQPL